MTLTLEERIKRIEDELGITEREDRKKLLNDVRELCINYQFTKRKAKEFAWTMVNEGYTYQQLEQLLIDRGAVCNF
jgi:hypothetical protein